MYKTAIREGSLRETGIAAAFLGFGLSVMPHTANAQNVNIPAFFDQGKLTATGGVNTISGASGGGIVPWALIGGDDTNKEIGGSVFYSHVFLNNFNVNVYGGTADFFDRFEVSYARQNFNLGTAGPDLDNKIIAGLGLSAGTTPADLPHSLQFPKNSSLNQDIFGAKLRVYGNAVYDQFSYVPQISIGYQYHHNENVSTIRAIGSKPDGNEYYLAATKIWIDGLFGHYTTLSATLDFTNAVQNGLLGFGGVGQKTGYHVEPEFSGGWFVTRNLVVGGEYKFLPHFQQVGYVPLGNEFSKNSNWEDLYVAFFPIKQASITLAYVNLGSVASFGGQNGLYVSLNSSF